MTCVGVVLFWLWVLHLSCWCSLNFPDYTLVSHINFGRLVFPSLPLPPTFFSVLGISLRYPQLSFSAESRLLMSPADVPSIFAVVFLSCISSYSFLEFPSLRLHCPSVVLCHLLCASASWLVVICFRFPV